MLVIHFKIPIRAIYSAAATWKKDWNEEKHPRHNNGQFSKGDYGTNVKVDNKDIKSYTELFKGMKTSNGIVIKSVTGHGTG